MSNSNSNKRIAKTKARQSAAQSRKQLKNELLNDIRAAAGIPAKGKGRGKRNRQAKRMGNQRGQGAIAMGDAPTVLQHAPPQLDDILEKDEFVVDLLGSGGVSALNIQKFAFNPGQASLFPLGSAEAAKWTCWECISAEPYLLHEVSEFATDGSTGKVYLAFDYNAANNTATTKQQLADMHSASCMPCEDIGLKLKPSLLNKADPKYVRTGLKPAGTDVRLYDGGVLYVAAIGQAGTTKLAELRIRYKFRLCLPTLLNPTGGLSDDSTVAQFHTLGYPTSAGGEATNSGVAINPMLLAIPAANGLGAVNTAGSIVPPAGDYLITTEVVVHCSGTPSACVLILLKNGAAIAKADVPVIGNNGSVSFSWLMQANGTDAFTVSLTPTFAGGGSSANWGAIIFQLV